MSTPQAQSGGPQVTTNIRFIPFAAPTSKYQILRDLFQFSCERGDLLHTTTPTMSYKNMLPKHHCDTRLDHDLSEPTWNLCNLPSSKCSVFDGPSQESRADRRLRNLGRPQLRWYDRMTMYDPSLDNSDPSTTHNSL